MPTTLSPSTLAQQVAASVTSAMEDLGARGASLWATQPSGENRLVANFGEGQDLSGLTVPAKIGIIGRAAMTQQIEVTNSCHSEPAHLGAVSNLSRVQVSQMLTVPIPDQRLIVQFVNTRHGSAFADRSAIRAHGLVSEVGRQLALAELERLKTFVPQPLRQDAFNPLNSDFQHRDGHGAVLLVDKIDSHHLVRTTTAARQSVSRALNKILAPAADIIRAHGGWVVSYPGDAVLGCFEELQSGPSLSPEARAFLAAMNIQRQISERLQPQVRIALAQGPFEVSAIGSADDRRISIDGETIYEVFDIMPGGKRRQAISLSQSFSNALLGQLDEGCFKP